MASTTTSTGRSSPRTAKSTAAYGCQDQYQYTTPSSEEESEDTPSAAHVDATHEYRCSDHDNDEADSTSYESEAEEDELLRFVDVACPSPSGRGQSEYNSIGPPVSLSYEDTQKRQREQETTPLTSIIRKKQQQQPRQETRQKIVASPTPTEWLEAYSADKELNLITILLRNQVAKASYEQNTRTSEFRLRLHNELMLNQLMLDQDDNTMIYLMEEDDGASAPVSVVGGRTTPTNSSSSSSSSVVGCRTTPTTPGGRSAASATDQSAVRTKPLRIVPHDLRRRIFDGVLQQSSTSPGVGAYHVFHRIRQRYYWPNMYADINAWWAQYGQDMRMNPPTHHDGDDVEEYYNEANYGENGMPTEKDADVTQDTALDVSVDTTTAIDRAGVTSAKTDVIAATDIDNDMAVGIPKADEKMEKNKTKKKGKIAGLRRALSHSLTPTRKMKNKKDRDADDDPLVTVESNFTNTISASPSYASATSSAGGNDARAYAPAILRRSSLSSLFRTKSSSGISETGLPPRSRPSTPLPSSSPLRTPMRGTSSSNRLPSEKSCSSNQIGKKLPGVGGVDGNGDKILPGGPDASGFDNEKQQTTVATAQDGQTEPVLNAHLSETPSLQQESDGCESNCFSMNQLQSVSGGLGSFIDALSDEVCNGGLSSDDDDDTDGFGEEKWQRAVPAQ